MPSSTLFSTALSGNVTVAAPAGIVTLAGTLTRVGWSLLRVIVSGAVVLPLRTTVPTAARAPAASLKLGGLVTGEVAIVNVRVTAT